MKNTARTNKQANTSTNREVNNLAGEVQVNTSTQAHNLHIIRQICLSLAFIMIAFVSDSNKKSTALQYENY